MLNINYGKNKALMKSCEALNEYAWLVEAIRKNQSIMGNIEYAVEATLSEMPEDFVIKKFLLLNKAEVKGMFLTEWDQEKVLEQERRDSLNLGITQTNERVARDMLIDGKPLAEIKKYSRLTDDMIHGLAKTLGVTVP